MKDFASDNMVKILYGSNSQEGTLPKNLNGNTYVIVQNHLKNGDLFKTECDDKWNADGRFSNQEGNQIFRHFNAKQILNRETNSTVDNVKRVHSILMENAVNANKPIDNGKFRKQACYTAGTQPAHDVRTTLYGRCYDVKTLKRRPYNVVLTSCAGWVLGRLIHHLSA